ncbi:hypothetical protein PL9631_110120 [Planktothrix paucivesiculata PCC 9631]|uniref:Uncharacterized protein n=1 Tax=Planktothrix paucivesiculata PCC 9631 TaxID=671071 RepID=A0A7Z9DW40_9CYAN|nr:hypothetical protein PL9631_110120 [Planktothrix paucivesiculata PCC 9631]
MGGEKFNHPRPDRVESANFNLVDKTHIDSPHNAKYYAFVKCKRCFCKIL